MGKKYFIKKDDEFCYTEKGIKDIMKAEGFTELTVIEAQRETGSDFLYCKEFGEVGERAESCGKNCESYDPNNGKNGRCKHYGYVYQPTDNEKTIIIKQ